MLSIKRYCGIADSPLALGMIVISLVGAFLGARVATPGGQTAVLVNGANLAWFLIAGLSWQHPARLRLLAAGALFGLVELIADFLCVRSTRTLDYSIAHSPMLAESPWWMPLAWALVAVQLGLLGNRAIQKWGLWRGALLTGVLGALVIPLYEELAFGAHWWRYERCLLLGHTPLYIVLAELTIAAGLAVMGFLVMTRSDGRTTALAGVLAGILTIVAGLVGWGVVEFLGRGARPSWPW